MLVKIYMYMQNEAQKLCKVMSFQRCVLFKCNKTMHISAADKHKMIIWTELKDSSKSYSSVMHTIEMVVVVNDLRY